MNWTVILDAATGRANALNQVVRRSSDECAALQTLLLLAEAPHAAAALVAAAPTPDRIAPLVHAALAPSVAPALAAWRADPQWVDRVVGADVRAQLTWGVAGMVGALRNDPGVLRDAFGVVLHDADPYVISRCLEALGADGWKALEDEQRRTLLTRAPADALGRVWDALDDAQREATTQRAESTPNVAADCIGCIGAAAWRATDPALRRRLIAAVARDPGWVSATAPAWAGMTDDERARLATPVITSDRDRHALDLLKALGAAGRATLTVEQRAALDARAMEHLAAWLVLAFRAADAGWSALTDDERDVVLAATEEETRDVADLLRAVGVAGWNAMSADDQARLAAVARGAPTDLFRCPPAFWPALAGAALPPATDVPEDAPFSWRSEEAAANLSRLPPAHQALVLALAPWRTDEVTKDSVRVRRLRAVWDALPADERAALATAHPLMLAQVAAAARLHGGAAAAVESVGATVGRWAAAVGGADAKRAVGAMLRTPDDWRAWMAAFAPTDGDPSETWDAWRRAARRGILPDPAMCARLADEDSSLRRTRLRAGR